MASSVSIPHEEFLDKRTVIFVVVTNVIVLAWSLISAATNAGWVSISVLAYSFSLVYLGYALFTGNRLILHLMLFGLVAGLCELASDAWAVQGNMTLVYPNEEPMIWASPLYMPFSWIIVFTQLGLYSLLLTQWKGLLAAVIGISIFGGMYIPLYEHLAKDAGWWFYQNTPMLFNAPYYVIIAEAMLSLSVPLLIFRTAGSNYSNTGFLAVAQGIWIFISGWLAFNLINLLCT